MRPLIVAIALGVVLVVVGSLGISSATATEEPPLSLSGASPSKGPESLCDHDPSTEPLEPEVFAACFEASRPSLTVKRPEVDDGSASGARDLAYLDHDPASFGPDSGPGAMSQTAALPSPPSAGTVPVADPTAAPYHVEDNHDVRRFLDQFQTGYRRAVVERWLIRAGRYLPMVLNVFRQKGLPEELVFTAMIESGFDPLAVSRAGARGLWQFMAPTAKRYGLRVDRWMDERLDPEKSTAAAARHFIDLYAVFGSWNLAQAAYNAGERTVLEAIRAMGTSDFWALTRGRRLADETKNYIPAIKAATLIAREPERYGFMVTPAAPLMYDVVSVPGSTSLKVLASKSGLDPDALERLNPELRLKQTPPGGTYPLKVPVGGTGKVREALDRDAVVHVRGAASPRGKSDVAASPTRPSSHGIHVVKRQETVSVIAKRYGVSVADLIRWNHLDDTARIRVGDRLRVAAAGHDDPAQQ
jgi:membrane-bound lytic murein transglycosylase D